MATRGERIAQKARNRERWRRIFRQHPGSFSRDAGWVDRVAAKAAQHGKLCSCMMCGNPRRYFGDETIQERKAACAELCSVETYAD